MADNWSDYLWGSDDQRLRDLDEQQRQLDAAKQSPDWQALRRMAYKGVPDVDFDPRQAMYRVPTPDGGAVGDTLHPRRSSDAAEDGAAAMDYALQMGTRLRDTGIRAAQELSKGNYADSLGLAARAVPAAFYPPAAAGTYGAEDDWREHARKIGVPEASIMAIDWGTDPEMWLTAPVSGPAAFVVPALPFAAAKAVRSAGRVDDVIGALGRGAGRLRYGPGAQTELVDQYGEVIRRLRNSPSAQPMRLEYVRP